MSEHDVMEKCTKQLADLQAEVARLRAGVNEATTLLARGRTVGNNWQVNAILAEDHLRGLLAQEH